MHRFISVALVLSLAANSAGAQARLGIEYTFRLSGSLETRGRTTPAAGMLARGRVVDRTARLDFDSLQNRPMPMAETGGYMIMSASSDNLTIVVPSRKESVQITLSDFAKFTVGAMTAGPNGPKLKISNVEVTTRSLGAGNKIAGYATKHFRITQSYTITVAAMTQTHTRQTRTTTDYWVAPGLKQLLNPYLDVERAMTHAAMSALDGGAQLMERTTKARTRLGGAPLRIVTTTTDSDEGGTSMRRVTTSEVLNLRRTVVDASAMKAPADYLKRELPPKQ